MERLALEAADAFNAGQLQRLQPPRGDDEVARPDNIAAVGADGPARIFVGPAGLGDLRLEEGSLVQVEVPRHALQVLEDLGLVRVLLGRDVPGLLQERQVDVGLGVALSAGVAIPVPGPADVARLVDEHDPVNAGPLQIHRLQQRRDASPQDHRVDAGLHRLAAAVTFDPRVLAEPFESVIEVDVLIQTVGPQALAPLLLVLLASLFEGEPGGLVRHSRLTPTVRAHKRAARSRTERARCEGAGGRA